MKSATWPRATRTEARLLHIDPQRKEFVDQRIVDLPGLLDPGDLLVVNDAATLPASLRGTARGVPIEVRLAGQGPTAKQWSAVLFGAGSWRQRTEERPVPPVLAPGEWIELEAGLRARVQDVSAHSERLVGIEFDRDGESLWTALYRAGEPVQYSYVRAPLPLWHVQTVFAARPWAFEMPSAGRVLSSSLVQALRREGIRVASLTHAAGLSSTGDATLDALLPLPERYEIPLATVQAIETTHSGTGRVVGVGTTVVRALEGCAAANDGRLRDGAGTTDLHIGADFVPRIAAGLLTGMHEPGTSHFDLLQAFACRDLLEAANGHTTAAGYLAHEFGDATLVLAASRVASTGRLRARDGASTTARILGEVLVQ
jgi:S-adenosylmethionine:tRNA ribosyltransferase-isomerase